MVIVYRIEASAGATWVTKWEPTLDLAKRVARSLLDADYSEVSIDKLDVNTSRESLVAALNHAHDSRVNWEGEPVEWAARARP